MPTLNDKHHFRAVAYVRASLIKFLLDTKDMEEVVRVADRLRTAAAERKRVHA